MITVLDKNNTNFELSNTTTHKNHARAINSRQSW